jgi:drug/metabolite transporter (DMT)-like permease
VTRKGLILFLIVGVAWGTPYFFIAIALHGFHTASIVWLRVAVAALVLLPLAIRRGVLKPALKAWPWVLVFAVLEMVGPWYFITEAERSISSSLVGLLITTVPFIAAFVVGLRGDRSAWHPKTVLGLIIGLAGVIALVGLDVFSGEIALGPVILVILAAIGYAVAPIIASEKISDVSTLGVITLSLVMVAIIYAIPAAFTLPADIMAGPTTGEWLSVVYLGVVASAVAFLVFFALIKEIGPARSTLITYLNLLVAMILGVVFLSEPITSGILVGLPLVVIGSYLASQRRVAYIRKKNRAGVTEPVMPERL